MANIALGKLPIEKAKWKRPEVATDGNITNYNGNDGFAHASFPCTFTLDLSNLRYGQDPENPRTIHSVRFLLWDGLGNENNNVDKRKYTFSFSVSNDGENFVELFSNNFKEGWNGWTTLEFNIPSFVKFVRLTGLNNTRNGEFHIVEFEVHTEEPPELKSKNHRKFIINRSITNADEIDRLIKIALKEKQGDLDEIEKLINVFKDQERRLETSLKHVGLFNEALTFINESKDNLKRGNFWVYVSLGIFVLFIITITIFIWGTGTAHDILCHDNVCDYSETHTTMLLTFFYIGKATIISVILFALSWTLKNYRSERHNYVINKHKALSLSTAIGILVNPEYKDIEKEELFKEVLKNVFSHQNTGYSKEDNSSPSILNNVTNKKDI